MWEKTFGLGNYCWIVFEPLGLKYPTKCSPPICCFLFRIRQKQQEKPFWRQNAVGASSKQRHFLALHCVKGINPRSSDASLCWPSWSISIFHIYAGKKGVLEAIFVMDFFRQIPGKFTSWDIKYIGIITDDFGWPVNQQVDSFVKIN